MSLKDTIFLPVTDFQMRGNLDKKEPEILEYWDKLELYEKVRIKSKNCKKFIFHDGPPFANGVPHAGTAMNKILKDIIVKIKQLQGFDATFVPGWDCHGLPIEWKVEEQLREKGEKKETISTEIFRNMCKDFANYWIDIQKNGFKRLGVNADWNNPYLTMNKESEATVIRQIGAFITDGSLYRGERPVYWSVVEQTALADAEIEYMDKKSTSIYVAFKIKKTDIEFLENAFCVIWTTTPWTIPGNRAISYSKDIEYCLCKLKNEKSNKNIIIAKDLIENFSKTTDFQLEIINHFNGELLKNTICHHPLYEQGYEFDVPLINGEHVEITAGTGLVHTAPGHGLEDFYICKKFEIKVPLTVNEAGIYYDCVSLFAGKHIFKVEKEILQTLLDCDNLIFQSSINHSYPHSWRSKAPLIFRTTPQWFISMDNTNLRKKALAEIDKVNWVPKQGYNRIKSFIENRVDWCVSRQRVWGIPLPLFIDKKTGEPLRDNDVIQHIAQIFEKEGSNAWFAKDDQYLLGNKYKAENYTKITDTLDVWFESSSTFAYVVKKDNPENISDLYLEGSDQHRGWFQHSLLNSCGSFGNAPFKTVLTHGFIVDEKGRKMSKSLGNTVTLSDIVDKYGADIYRMWVASSDFTQDLKLGTNILKQLEDVYRKLRNSIRYMLGALANFNEKEETTNYNDLPDLEKWILHRITEIHAELIQCINNYDINKYFTIIHTFCSSDLSSFFFDIRKDSLYCDHKNYTKRKAYRYVLHILFEHIIRWLSPIITYTAEEAWLSMHKTSSVHLQTFITPETSWENDELSLKFNKIKEIRKLITTALEIARKDKKIGSNLQASVTLLDPNSTLPTTDIEFWKEITITSDIKISNSKIEENAFILEEIPNIAVLVELAKGEKCERCWKIFPNLKEDKICDRCQKVLAQ